MKLAQDGKYTKGREARWKEGNDLIIERLKKLSKHYNLMVLDVGCGEAYNYNILMEKMQKEHISKDRLIYHALDNNSNLKDILKETEIKLQVGDIKNLRKIYKTKYFDVIIASEIIEHLVETDKFILDIKHILKDNGHIFLTTPNLASWHGIISLILGYQPLSTEISCVRSDFGKIPLSKRFYQDVLMHVRPFTIRGLKEFLEYHGFIIEKINGGGYRTIDNILFKKILIGISPIIKVIIRKNLDV